MNFLNIKDEEETGNIIPKTLDNKKKIKNCHEFYFTKNHSSIG